MPTTEEFGAALDREFREAMARKAPSVQVNSGDLHRRVGGYPGPDHSMPTCCDVMYAAKRPDDVVLTAPPKGKGASLTIRYTLPR